MPLSSLKMIKGRSNAVFQKYLYFNCYLSGTWFLVTLILFITKLEILDHLTKYLSLAVFTLLAVIESTRLYLGYYGNLNVRVPELAGFLMLTFLMQLPLVSYFLFNSHLLSTPTEVTLHAMMWLVSVTELVLGYLSLKSASALTTLLATQAHSRAIYQ